ncbi:MAG: cell division protein FtsX [Flavobacteriales bacterium]
MASDTEKFNKRRLRSSYLTAVVSISLVLFIIGLLGIVMLNAKKIADNLKENFTVMVVFKETATDANILAWQSKLNEKEWIAESVYISKQQAAEEFKEEVGEDFVEFLGFNPLPATLEIHLKPEYTEVDKIKEVQAYLEQNSLVDEVRYQEMLIAKINRNVRKVSLALLIISGLLAFISITLINNTIRLSIYSKRFIIKTMLLVGATRSFIRRPFLAKSLLQGALGGIIAVTLLFAFVQAVVNEIPELGELQDIREFAIIAGAILLLGVVLSGISTYFAVNKFIKMKTDYLY